MGQITSTYHLHTCVNFFKDILEESKSDLVSVTYIILTYLKDKEAVFADPQKTYRNIFQSTVVCIKVRRPSFPRFWKNHP